MTQKTKFSLELLYINIMIVLLVIIMVVVGYQSLETEKESIQTEVENTLREVETRIVAGVASTLYLNATAAEIYRNDDIPLKTAKKVHEINAKADFALDDPTIANLTGFGGLENKKKLLHEMATSLELTQYFKIVKGFNKSLVRVYYVSKNNFATYYPFVWSDRFVFSKKMMDKELWKKALPENNEEGKLFFTSLHKDELKDRILVTVGHPFYYKNNFLGTVNLDIAVAGESLFLDSKNLHHGTYVIVDKSLNVIAASGLEGFSSNTIYDAKELLNREILETPVTINDNISLNSQLVFVKNFESAPWRLYYIIDKQTLYLSTYYYIGMMFLLVVLLFGVKVLFKRLAKSREEVAKQALTDPMTKLYNRRYIAEITPHLIGLAQRNNSDLSVIILDIDKFKNVNDTYGHQVGDDVIVALADVLMQETRKSDVVCRFGGEEFVILLPETPSDGAFAVAENLRKVVEKLEVPLDDGKTLHFTISMGVSIVSPEDKNFDAAITRADTALYEAKESGRNRVCQTEIENRQDTKTE